MPNAKDLIERARMFEELAERVSDPISRQHYWRPIIARYQSSTRNQSPRRNPSRHTESAPMKRPPDHRHGWNRLMPFFSFFI